MLNLTILSSSDASDHFSRPDYFSFSQQTLMELLVDGISNKEKICGTSIETQDISKWNHVSLTRKLYIEVISWSTMSLEGTINLQWLPQTTTFMSVSVNKLSGTLDLENLPPNLKSLYLFKNQFIGTVCLTSLPNSLEKLFLSNNKLSGTIDLTKLGKYLTHLNLSNNFFCGVTDFSVLPESLKMMNLSNTDLEGVMSIADGSKESFTVDSSKVRLDVLQSKQ